MSVPLKRNTAGQIVYVVLMDGADIVTTPTIVDGDIQLSLDGGALNNPTTTPSETPVGSGQVQIPLSQAETNAVHVGIRGIDQVGAEWDDFYYSIFTDTDTIGGLSTTLTAITASLAAITVTLATMVSDTCACVTGWFSKHVSSILSRVKGDDIDIVRGDTMDLDFERVGDISTRTNMWFTVKDDKDGADTDAIIQIDEDTGLLRIAGAAPTAAANGSITVTDAVVGDFTVWLAPVEAAKITDLGKFYYDIQFIYAGGVVSTPVRGRAYIIGDVTRATS